MREYKCKVIDCQKDIYNNMQVTFSFGTQAQNLFEQCILARINKLDMMLKLDKFRKKRSLDANAYLWKLCSEIAEKVGGALTKEDVYKKHVKEGNVFEILYVKDEAIETFKRLWACHGLGWLIEKVGKSKNGFSMILAYKGSSEYNSKEMSSLIDRVVLEAKELGIETMTSNEIEDMISLIDQSK